MGKSLNFLIGSLAVVLLAMILLFSSMAVFKFGIFSQEAVDVVVTGDKVTTTGGGAVVTTSLAGRDATLVVRVDNVEASSITAVPSPIYIKSKDPSSGSDVIRQINTNLVTTGTTVTGYSVDDVIDLLAFNDTWEGEWTKGYKINSQSPSTIVLKVHRNALAGQVEYTATHRSIVAQTALFTGTVNLTTMGADGSDNIEWRVRVNATYTSVNLGGFFFDLVPAGSNISSISLVGLKASLKNSDSNYNNPTFKTGSKWLPAPARSLSNARTGVADKIFSVENTDGSPLRLHGSTDYIDFTTSFLANGNGCGADNTGESIVMRAYDVQPYLSYTNDKILMGAETDAPTPVDVGSPDFASITFYCRSSSGG